MLRNSALSRTVFLFLTVGGWVVGCGSAPIDGNNSPPSLTVTSTNPVSALRDLTLDVHVIGTGFEQGTRAFWARGSDTAFAKTRVKVNSISFVSTTELVANITVEADAHLGSYDVRATAPDGRIGGPRAFDVNLSIETVDLGAGDNSVARGLNNQGQVVGDRGANPETVQAFVWKNGTITNLGVLPGMTFSYAYDINDAGQVVGVSGTGTLNSPDQQIGFVWTQIGGMQALGTLGGISFARAINDGGDIVGYSTASGNNTQEGHAVVWRNGVITDLQPAAFAGDIGHAFAINRLGEAVGWVYSRLQAFRWTSTGGLAPLDGGLPFGINDAGCVAGWVAPGGVAAAYRSCAGVAKNVGSCGGGGSRAWAINNAGQVVGDAGSFAFLWTETDGITCFPLAQGSNGSGANGINDLGWVVGSVSSATGGGHATLWKVK